MTASAAPPTQSVPLFGRARFGAPVADAAPVLAIVVALFDGITHLIEPTRGIVGCNRARCDDGVAERDALEQPQGP